MMRIFLYFLSFIIALVSFVYFGHAMIGQKGYVLITFGVTKIEMTVVSAVILLVGVYAFFWFAIRIIATLLAMGNFSLSWFSGLGERRKHKQFHAGLLAYHAGDFEAAKKQLKGLNGQLHQGLDLLVLAEIEARNGNVEEQQIYLHKAQLIPEAKVAASVKLIEQASNNKDFAQAHSVLDNLSEEEAKLPAIVAKKATVLAQSGRWKDLEQNLKSWKKVLSKEDYSNLSQQAALGAYTEVASKEGANQLRLQWQSMPRKTKKDEAHQAAYIQQLIDQGMHADAEQELVALQKKGPSTLLLSKFKQLRLTNPSSSTKLIENWLKSDENNREYLSILGHLAYQSQNFDLAQKALEKAIKLERQQEDLILLAKIKEHNQDSSGALQIYKQTLQNH